MGGDPAPKSSGIQKPEQVIFGWPGCSHSGDSDVCLGCYDLTIDRIRQLIEERDHHKAEAERLQGLIWTPHTQEFLEAVQIEAAHQRDRWGEDHDALKEPVDWYWLLGWLAGKAARPETPEKRLHHIVTTAAACLNWHRWTQQTTPEKEPQS